MSLGGGGGTQPVKRLPEQTASAGAAGAEPTTGTLQRSRPCQCHRPSRGKASILPSKCPLFFFFFFTPLSPSPFPRPLILSTEPLDRHCVPGSPLPTSGETTRGGGGVSRQQPPHIHPRFFFFFSPPPAQPGRTEPYRVAPASPPPPPAAGHRPRGGWWWGWGVMRAPQVMGKDRPGAVENRQIPPHHLLPNLRGNFPAVQPSQRCWERLRERESIPLPKSEGVFHLEGPSRPHH